MQYRWREIPEVGQRLISVFQIETDKIWQRAAAIEGLRSAVELGLNMIARKGLCIGGVQPVS